MPNTETMETVEVEVRIAAAPETVFDFLVDPDRFIQWMGRSVELDPRPGGRLHCDVNGRSVASGEYVVVEAPRRVVFTWGWEPGGPIPAPGMSTVEVLLEPDGDGTRLRLIHSDLPGAESAEKHRHGWEHYTARLTTVASGGDPGADPWATTDDDK